MRVWMGRGFSTRTGSRTHEVCHQEPCSEQRAEHTGDAEVSKLLLRLHENRRLHDALRDALEDKLLWVVSNCGYDGCAGEVRVGVLICGGDKAHLDALDPSVHKHRV